MQTGNGIQNIEDMVKGLLANHPDHFLVEVRHKPVNNFKIFIDSDKGVDLSVLIKYNRSLYRQIEEQAIYPEGDFSLEVSSPGLDEPLKLHRQYKKNIGRFADILLNDTSKKEGKLVEVLDEAIILETEQGKGKTKSIQQETILFSDIKSTKIQIKF
ncbi:MAG: ribosome maturation factor [Chitinophagaceae bacterium]